MTVSPAEAGGSLLTEAVTDIKHTSLDLSKKKKVSGVIFFNPLSKSFLANINRFYLMKMVHSSGKGFSFFLSH